MPIPADVAGSYEGRARVREGMESQLAPVERKRFLKNTEVLSLQIHADGTFDHKGTTKGTCEAVGERIVFQPVSFNGVTLESMQKAAEEDGRSFGLSWLFAPFELVVRGGELVGADERALVYVAYQRRA